jgi:chemotaxis methyl-accepting protein methylase
VKRRASGRARPVEHAPRPPLAAAGWPLAVGIGASAGGLDALEAFFAATPPDTGLAFIVAHLDPGHESALPALLAKCTPLKVQQASDRALLEANHVYIVPPDGRLTLDRGLIRVTKSIDRRARRGTIDRLFRSLAADQRERAVAIILSGRGTEGSLGLRAVKAEGGMVMAQAPETAVHPGMPSSAIATGLVDVVLPPAQMPGALVAYAREPHPRLPPTGAAMAGRMGDQVRAIIALLKARTKHDFIGYRRGTLRRRIVRRMGLLQIRSVAGYLELLKTDPTEVDRLFKDLLISVTGFFRDAPAFEELATSVLAKLVREPGDDRPVRIWVPACATGEEAYSIAIVAAEQAARVSPPRRVQIVATDIDDAALEIARAGVYPGSIALDVTPGRLERFFTREDHQFRVGKPLRESVVFATHNLVADPPLSHLDLVSCRNVLIYLEPELQRRLISRFHFALNPGGYLFVGASEHAGDGGLFTTVSKRWRIYSRVGPVGRPRLRGDSVRRVEAELETVHDELRTVNAELQQKVDALTTLNSQLRASERTLAGRLRYANAIATLNYDALAGLALSDLLDRCVTAVSATLGVECAELCEYHASSLRSRAAVGWLGATGASLVAATAAVPEGAAILAGNTLVFSGLTGDARFTSDTRIRDRHLESGISTIVRCNQEPWGVLTVFSSAARSFSPEEVSFVEAVARTVGAAVSRARAEDAVRLLIESLERRIRDIARRE